MLMIVNDSRGFTLDGERLCRAGAKACGPKFRRNDDAA